MFITLLGWLMVSPFVFYAITIDNHQAIVMIGASQRTQGIFHSKEYSFWGSVDSGSRLPAMCDFPNVKAMFSAQNHLPCLELVPIDLIHS
ncbi:hypothetical protein C8R32_110106 [Nitrosospira sp. Nsp5]|uniref:Uncharacterized protein n=1 Tax=Nitrosospira multiformis TaxID=1231 RepID=A0ABY0TBT9_9PROT|nr:MULTISPECIES: hypothetical protein [Nitrosospira]PTR06622.1 hypothetical protein C8R32_110106 [Nitrosospira sp. Nsp5]SDQ36091.1 hypothetical protein SAMN05216402_0552 [Nitrosospira multiformis]